VSPSERDRDKRLKQRRYDLIHAAATVLAKNSLINYDRKSGNFQVTDLGMLGLGIGFG
jgi:pre-mRNA-splicing helicase BRR2